jgi:hypothetical protein
MDVCAQLVGVRRGQLRLDRGLTPAGLPSEVINDRQWILSAMVGVNHKIHWDGPVVAKF